MLDANGDLVNGATVNGSSTIVWSDVWGSYYFGGSTQWNSSSGSFASWFNSSWAEQYWDGNYCSGCNPTVVFQLDANLVVYGPGPPAAAPGPVHLSTSSTAYWATLSHSFPIPLTGGADGTSPGYYEQIAWLYATAQPGADPDGDGDSVLGDTDGSDDSTVWACALNAGAYPAIEPNGTAPPGGCQAQVCPPVQQSVYCNLSVQVPAAGGAFFAEPVLLEWYAAGSQSGFGAQWTFHLATGPSEYIAEMPSLALSAGTGSATTGQGVPFTFSYDPGGGYGYGINPGDTLKLTVVSASPGSYAGTAPSSMTCTAGSGKTGSCTVWGTDTTAQTVTYQVVDTATGFMSNTVTVTWWPPGSPSLSAAPSSLTAGQATSFTVSASFGAQVRSGDQVAINVVSTSPGPYAGSTPASCSLPSAGSCTSSATDGSAQTVTYQAVDTATGATSNTVTVTWAVPGSLSLSAAPSSLTTGQATSFTVSASFGTQVRSGDQVAINVVSTSPGPYAGSTPASCSLPSAGSCTSSATDGSAQTVTYQAVDTATGATSNTVTVTWAVPGSLSLSAAPSSLTTGQATSFTVSASFGTQVRSGDQVAINVVSTSPGPYAGST